MCCHWGIPGAGNSGENYIVKILFLLKYFIAVLISCAWISGAGMP
jgi:hypothetical protein